MSTRDLYLNHAGTSWPKPDVVLAAVQEAMSISPADWPRRFEEAHQTIAHFFGVTDARQILLTPGCTSALSVGISDSFFAPGKRVLTSNWEHHALHRPLLQLALRGVTLDYLPTENSDRKQGDACPVDLNWLEQSLSKGDVGMVAITAACNVTGELLPYEDVIRLAHRYGSMVLVDAAQIVGWQRLDLPLLGADLVAFGGHKGLLAPWGIGGLYLSEEAQMVCTSATCELPIAGKANEDQLPRPDYCDVGSVDQFALAGLHAAILWHRQQQMEVRLADARRQIQRFREALESIDGVRLYGASKPDHAMPSLAFAVSGVSSGEVASQLRHRQVMVGSGIHCATLAHQQLGTEASGLVRLSVGVGQPDSEIDAAIDRLRSTFEEAFLLKS